MMWNRAVTIELKGQQTVYTRSIRSTAEAARCLLDDWPTRSGEPYKQAIIGCKMALVGQAPDTVARFSFQAAAQAAHVFVKLSNDIAQADELIAEITEVAAMMYAEDFYGGAKATLRP